MGWISWFVPALILKDGLSCLQQEFYYVLWLWHLLFNYQVMGFAEELLFKMSYQTTGKYSNGYAVGAGVVMLIGLVIMFYASRRLVRSVMEAVIPEGGDSLLDTIFTQRKLSNGPAITVIGAVQGYRLFCMA